MTAPRILDQLGPNYDVSQLQAAINSGAFKAHPEVEQLAKQVVQVHALRASASDKMSSDVTQVSPAPPSAPSTLAYLGEAARDVGAIAQSIVQPQQGLVGAIMGKNALPTDRRIADIMQQFGHDLSAGLLPAPKLEQPQQQAVFDMVVKPVTSIGAMLVQGYGIGKALGYVTKIPAAATVLEKIPERLQEIGAGTIVGGALGALEPNTQNRVQSIEHGAIGGAVLGSVFIGIAKGLELGKTVRLTRQIPDEAVPEIKSLLEQSGITLPQNFSKFQLAQAITKNLSKVVQNKQLAGATGDLLSRQKYIADAVYEGSPLSTDDERVLGGIFRTNPSGLNIVTGLTDADVADKVAKKLGVNIAVAKIRRGETTIELPEQVQQMTGREIRARLTQNPQFVPRNHPFYKRLQDNLELARAHSTPGLDPFETALQMIHGETFSVVTRPAVKQSVPVYDLIISRPSYTYQNADELNKEAKRIIAGVEQLGTGVAKGPTTPLTTESYLLPSGKAVRGGFSLSELANKLRVQVPAGVDAAEALKQRGMLIRLDISGTPEAPELRLELPKAVTQEQFNSIGKSVDAMRFAKVTLVSPSGEQVLENPLGAQVQDALVGIIKPRAVSAGIDNKLVRQFERSGVFEGQAALLHDGSPVTIVRKAGALYDVQDPILGKVVRVHPSKLTILPTSLSNEFQPSNLFTSALAPDEQAAFAKLRASLIEGLANPISKFSELRRFANSRGFYATQLKGKKIQLESALDGETVQFDGIEAAVEHVRKVSGPMPELTPQEIKRWLGLNQNPGFIGGSADPTRFGEIIPPRTDLLFEDIANAVRGRGPGVSSVLLPSRALFLDLDKKSGGMTDLSRHFENLQSGNVAKHNFIAAWFDGSAPGIDDGVMPLAKIYKLAGKNPNEEGITAWLEAVKGSPEAVALEKELTANELKAAKELRKWYNALFTRLGVEADYVENYAPRWRTTDGKYGSLPAAIWSGLGQDPKMLPRGAQFFADNYREGTLDIYDTQAFRVAGNYLRAGASNRYVGEVWNQAKQYAVLLNSDQRTRAYAKPFVDFLLALKGGEFAYQRKMVGETLQTLLESLPGTGTIDAAGIDKLTNYTLGVMYSSVLGGRPALALRNAIQPLLMTWPIVGGSREGFWEAVGRALTAEGKAQAIIDRAIDVKGTALPFFEEVQGTLPKVFQEANNKGMYLYDSADQFTRAVSYWAGRLRAEKALSEFASKAGKQLSASEAALARRQLIRDSGMLIQDPSLQSEFLRRAATNPTSAAAFAGKQLSDVTNFLYGRGMQARWMRSVPGRILGQFGTWPMWYIDYLRRVSTNMVRNGYRAEAARFLARHALVNAAIIYAGQKVLNIDLSRWSSYGSVFYSGGPALQLVAGVATLNRGLGSEVTGSEDPLQQSRITEGTGMINQVLPNFIPFYYAGRDAIRLSNAYDRTEALAAALSTKTTRDYQLDRALDIVLGKDNTFTASSPALEEQLNLLARGNPGPTVLTLDQINALLNGQASQGAAQGAGQGMQAGAPGAPRGALEELKSALPQPSKLPNEVVRPAESQPIKNY